MTDFKKWTTFVVVSLFALTSSQGLAAAQEATLENQVNETLPLLPIYELNADTYETEAEKIEVEASIAEVNNFNASLSPKTGEIELAKAGVTLNMGETHYYLNAKDSQKILVDLWENPENPNVLGMIFERNTDGYSNEYAVAIYFEATGYVSDEDAATIDYDDLLKDMKKQTKLESKMRIAEGYGGLELIGWGANPKYDAENHNVSWAQLIKFEGYDTNTLNYNMRFLGRKGVLEFNYIADEESLPVLEDVMPTMSEMAAFKPGHQYTDFNPATDKIATYGVAGLVAGGVVAKKLGLLGVLLLFLKKGWILIIAALAFGRRFFMSIFRGKSSETGV